MEFRRLSINISLASLTGQVFVAFTSYQVVLNVPFRAKKARKVSRRSSSVCFSRLIQVGRLLIESSPRRKGVVSPVRRPLGASHWHEKRHRGETRIIVDPNARVVRLTA